MRLFLWSRAIHRLFFRPIFPMKWFSVQVINNIKTLLHNAEEKRSVLNVRCFVCTQRNENDQMIWFLHSQKKVIFRMAGKKCDLSKINMIFIVARISCCGNVSDKISIMLVMKDTKSIESQSHCTNHMQISSKISVSHFSITFCDRWFDR